MNTNTILRPALAILASGGLILGLGACGGSGSTQSGSAAADLSNVSTYDAMFATANDNAVELGKLLVTGEQLYATSQGKVADESTLATLRTTLDDAENGLNQDLPTAKASDGSTEPSAADWEYAIEAMDVATTALGEHIVNLQGAIAAVEASLQK